MIVMIQLRLDVATDLHNRSQHARSMQEPKLETTQLLEAAARLGVNLTPAHPREPHELLAPYFMVETGDRNTAEQVIRNFQQLHFVEAAYLGPDSELPNK